MQSAMPAQWGPAGDLRQKAGLRGNTLSQTRKSGDTGIRYGLHPCRKKAKDTMSTFIRILTLAALLSLAGTGAVVAAAADYVFKAVTEQVPVGRAATIDVHLVHQPTGKPAENAVIFQSRLDMGPDGMTEMTTHLTPADEIEPGVYRFHADLSMAGRWALKLQAKVPGEPETIHGEVLIVATN